MLVLSQMQARKIVLNPYLDAEIVETVYKAMGVPLNEQTGDEDAVGEEIDEEV